MTTEPTTHAAIVAGNVRAVGVIYSTWMLEQSGAFRVIDRIVELFMQGELPLGGSAAQAVYRYAKAGSRYTAAERSALYALALGVPGGDTGAAEPNREFMHLWLRFLVAASEFAGRHNGAGLVVPPTPSNAAVREAARALAANASAHGGGVAAGAARMLVSEVQQVLRVLAQPDLLRAFGAREVWQLIDRIHRDHLGRLSHVAQFRAQAAASAVVFDWLVDNAAGLAEGAARRSARGADARLLRAVEALLATGEMAPESAPSRAPQAGESRRQARIEAHELLRALELTAGRERGTTARGLAVVFQGAPGSGTTLAAQVLAQALALPLVRVDLAAVVSKYIGETEKNLAALFDRAEKADALLLFDEADALFGRRSEVRDSHDRYANAAVDYLLQRIAAHDGALVLTASTQVNLDTALLRDEWRRRRWRVVRFPLPRG
ncbi:MAG TPA: ATP-binding protein [Burkholderiaceae bacterium]|nr:ATP-binding protein [Burkholderiaceae bacterium]HQR71087.1 ATP-binding protein [Burkholderiaceae bacterium]